MLAYNKSLRRTMKEQGEIRHTQARNLRDMRVAWPPNFARAYIALFHIARSEIKETASILDQRWSLASVYNFLILAPCATGRPELNEGEKTENHYNETQLSLRLPERSPNSPRDQHTWTTALKICRLVSVLFQSSRNTKEQKVTWSKPSCLTSSKFTPCDSLATRPCHWGQEFECHKILSVFKGQMMGSILTLRDTPNDGCEGD